jgi:hypothetical protein
LEPVNRGVKREELKQKETEKGHREREEQGREGEDQQCRCGEDKLVKSLS